VLYNQWQKHLRLSMRQTHRAGEKMFVDYCGKTVSIINAATGEVTEAQVFVAVLGASNFTFAEATASQKMEDWIGSHTRAFAFFGGVPQLIVPDNLKAAVTRACRYEPLLNQTYAEMLRHYNTVALPARPYKPRDKAKVEAAVGLVTRWILARLRHQQFFSLFELNLAIRRLLEELNDRAFKRLPGTRRSQFEALDKPALQPLPADTYEYAEWRKARVGIDYHVEVDRHFYSVPAALVKRQLEVRLTAKTIECLAAGKRVAVHVRSHLPGSHSTQAEHMPKAHRAHLEWTPGRLPRLGKRDRGELPRSRQTSFVDAPAPGDGLPELSRTARSGKALREDAARSGVSLCAYQRHTAPPLNRPPRWLPRVQPGREGHGIALLRKAEFGRSDRSGHAFARLG